MSGQQSGEKTEKPTPKKKKDTREQGQVFKSTELIAAFSCIVMFAVIVLFGDFIIENVKKFMIESFSGTYGLGNITGPTQLTPLLAQVVKNYLIIMSPILLAALLSGLIFNYIQVGFLFAPKAIKPKMSKISMIEGFKRLFSVRTVVELVKSILKISIIVVIAYKQYKTQIGKLPLLMLSDLKFSSPEFVSIIISVAFKIAIGIAVLTPLDFLYQWWKHNKDIKMTKQEVKEEYKLMEGDPLIKSKIKQKQREMSNMRMMAAMMDADVIITNPTHYAIAIRYDESIDAAPVILAKGKNLLAQKIKQKAKEMEIETVENRPLAQALYFYCEVGDQIPEDMYQAVAEILAYVYNLKQGIKGRI